MGLGGLEKVRVQKLFFRFPQPQSKATFLKRPQRFLAEMGLPDGSTTLAYCPNPGSLHGCLKPGSPALLWDSLDPTRKRRYTLRAVKLRGVWIGTDTHLANHLAEEALRQKLLPGLASYKTWERECSFGIGQRIDFMLMGPKGNCFLEVKSATVVHEGIARFPDSETPRGLKHLQGLTKKAKAGHRAVLLYVVQRNDATAFNVNGSHYSAYALAYKKARAAGVKMLALSVTVNNKGFCAPRLLPVQGN